MDSIRGGSVESDRQGNRSGGRERSSLWFVFWSTVTSTLPGVSANKANGNKLQLKGCRASNATP